MIERRLVLTEKVKPQDSQAGYNFFKFIDMDNPDANTLDLNWNDKVLYCITPDLTRFNESDVLEVWSNHDKIGIAKYSSSRRVPIGSMVFALENEFMYSVDLMDRKDAIEYYMNNIERIKKLVPEARMQHPIYMVVDKSADGFMVYGADEDGEGFKFVRAGYVYRIENGKFVKIMYELFEPKGFIHSTVDAIDDIELFDIFSTNPLEFVDVNLYSKYSMLSPDEIMKKFS